MSISCSLIKANSGYIRKATSNNTYYAFVNQTEYRMGEDQSGGSYLYRTFFIFNTSAINEYIKGATLHTQWYNKTHQTTVKVFNATCHDPITSADFDAFDTELGSILLGPISNSNTLVDIPLSTAGLNIGSHTKIAVTDDTETGSSKINDWYGTITRLILDTVTSEVQNLSADGTTDGTATIISGKYYNSDGNDSSKLRIQIASDSNFTNILYDSEQIDKVAANNASFTEQVPWVPTTEGTYYIRAAMWSSDIETQNPIWCSTYSYTIAMTADNIGALPLSDGAHIKFTATYHCVQYYATSQYQIQISDDSSFSNILYDSGQIDKTIQNGAEITEIINWFPNAEGIYYLRIGFGIGYDATSMTVSYPSVTSVDYTHNKEQYTFTAVIQDSYTKPPVVSIVVDNNNYLMELKKRTSIAPFYYTFSKNIMLEKGNHEYHVEVGNVWTTLIDASREMSADYDTNNMSIHLFSNTSKINAFNIVLTEKLLPDFSELSFASKDEIGTQTITAIVDTNGISVYTFDIQSIEKKQNGVNTYKCIATEKKDFEQITSVSSEVINSLDLLKSILPGYRFIGTLEENITLQQFVDMKIKDIFSFILVLNSKKACVRNKTIYIIDAEAKGKIFKNDIGIISFTEDRSKIVNRLREYYAIRQYPVPKNAITLLDATNWAGTVSDVQASSIGLVRNNPYFLKASSTISRSVDFDITNFDYISLAWNPETASSLEIRLETDVSNYYTYSRNFSGKKGAGFVLTGNQGDTVSKSISFTQTKISKVEGQLSDVATTRITLKNSGVVVGQSEWQTGTYFGQVFNNISANEIYLEFQNLYIVNNAFGINCYQLSITQYVQTYQTTGSKTFAVFSHHYSGSFMVSHPGGTDELIGSDVDLGSVYPLNSYDKQAINGYVNAYVVTKDNNGTFHYNVSVPMPFTIKTQDGKYILDIGTGKYPSNATAAYSAGHYEIDIRVDRTVSTGEYVWVYKTLDWSETYNLWDEFSIGLNNFSRVGSPSSQINTIRLVASGINYYDEIYLTTSSPNIKYVEYQDDDSIAKYGKRFQIRKTDGWSSKESAYSFAKGYVKLYKDPLINISREMHIMNNVRIGDAFDYNGKILYVYKVVQDWLKGTKTVFYGSETTNTLEFFKLIAHKIEALERSVL